MAQPPGGTGVRRRRWLPVGAAAVGLGPVLASLAHLAPGWVPAADVAALTVRSGDLFSRHLPLVGMPSTASEAGVQVFHPGPLQLWATGLARAVWDAPMTPLVVVVAVSAASVVAAVALASRRWGPTPAAAGASVAALVGWSLRGEVLASPFNPYAGFLPFCAYLVALLAAVEGTRGAAPAAVALGSWAGQTHLVYPGPVAATAAVALAITARRRGAGTLVARSSWGVWGLVALAWIGPLIDVVARDGGNVSAVLSRDGGPTLGPGWSTTALVQALGPRPVATKAGAGPLDLLASPAVASWVVGLGVLAALAVVAARARSRTAGVAAALVLAGLAATTALLALVPDDPYNTLALHNYLPLWPLVAGAWATLVAEAARAGARRWPRMRVAPRVRAGIALAAGGALCAASAVDLHRPTAEAERERAARVGDLVAPALAGGGPVAVHVDPWFEPFAIQTGLVARLDRAGVEVRVPASHGAAFGEHRIADGSEPTVLVTVDRPDEGAAGAVLTRTTFERHDGTVAEVVVTLVPPERSGGDGTLTAP